MTKKMIEDPYFRDTINDILDGFDVTSTARAAGAVRQLNRLKLRVDASFYSIRADCELTNFWMRLGQAV